jgi:hypothetical protein
MFGSKEFPQIGYPTPTSIPEESTCLTLNVPASVEWWALIVGVLYGLTLEWEWQQLEGGIEIGDAAARWAVMFNDAMDVAEATNQCESEIQAPYWDDQSDAPAEQPVSDQPWYGVLVGEATWEEQIGDWLIAGFIAYAGGPGAAIAFLTIAPRFRLAWRTHDLGALAKIFVNAADAGTVDTYSAEPGIVEVDVFADQIDPEAESYEIWVEQASSSQMQVIRKRLDPNEVYDTRYRYNPETDMVQYTPDGGTNWQNAPQTDPRHTDANRKPPVMADDPRCQAATNMTAWIKSILDEAIATVEAASGAASLITLFMPFFIELGPFALLVDLVASFLGVVFTAGASALSAAFTEGTYADLLCIFYCEIDSDGQVSAAQFATISGRIDGEIGGLVATVLDSMLFLCGEVGLSNAGTVDSGEVGDCSACVCHWCYEWDYTLSDGGALVLSNGVYVPGVGWQSELVGDAFAVQIAQECEGGCGATIDSFEVTVDYASGGDTFGNVGDEIGGTYYWTECAGEVNPDVPGLQTFTFDTTCNVDPFTAPALNFGGNSGDGVCTATKLKVSGSGISPNFTGGHAC